MGVGYLRVREVKTVIWISYGHMLVIFCFIRYLLLNVAVVTLVTIVTLFILVTLVSLITMFALMTLVTLIMLSFWSL